jgi:transcriptional regulator with XRE-family HTH domain
MHDVGTDPADPNLTVGQRVRFFRDRRGMTREALGGLVGRSARWVKAIESGQLQQPKLPMLIRLAEVLKVRDLAQLTGDQSMPLTLFNGPGHPALPAVRDAVTASPSLSRGRLRGWTILRPGWTPLGGPGMRPRTTGPSSAVCCLR